MHFKTDIRNKILIGSWGEHPIVRKTEESEERGTSDRFSGRWKRGMDRQLVSMTE